MFVGTSGCSPSEGGRGVGNGVSNLRVGNESF